MYAPALKQGISVSVHCKHDVHNLAFKPYYIHTAIKKRPHDSLV